MQNIKLDVENLPDDFKMTDKEIFKSIRDLFEMIKDNNQLINILDTKSKLLQK